MVRRLMCAVVVVCAACAKDEPSPVAQGEPLKKLEALDEGQLGKKEAPAMVKKDEGSASDAQKLSAHNARVAKLIVAEPQKSAGGLDKMFGPGGPNDETKKAMGNMFGAAPGEAHGTGGLGLRGSATGGGGLNGPVGLGGLGTRGRGGGTGAYGSGVSIGYGSGSGRAVGHGYVQQQVQVKGSLGVRGSAGGAWPADLESQSPDGVGKFENAGVNPFTVASEDRLSTFAADVDTASYTLARRVILGGRLPPEDSVRVEEFVNYFKYQYPSPAEGTPLGVSMELAPSPFTNGRHLLRVGVQAKHLAMHERKIAHLTFLVDVSGSMQSADKLPLAKRTLRMLVDQLRDGDTVALVTYAGAVKLVLPHTGMEHKARIHAAIEDLTAGGGTGMASGIELAYQQAEKVLDDKGYSRVIILSDGDANIGPASPEALLALIRGKVKEGVTVTTTGFGIGNYRDELMEKFSNAGNGNHHYIDSPWAARRVFVEQLGSTLEVVAQDVKLQVEFDPKLVKRYRLIGYENRNVADRDFRNDKVDGGEIGTGHSVTALYELETVDGAVANLATVRVRAKKPRGTEASEWAFGLKQEAIRTTFASASSDFRFATSVMAGAELFRRSPHARSWKLSDVLGIARGAAGESAERREYVQLLEQADRRSVLASAQ